jgi:dTDP-glucose 4,6-dehydratase
MRLLVTGGAGFIGSNFVRYWLAHHALDDVVNLDKLTYAGNRASLADVESDPRYRFVQGDICDPSVVDDVMRDADIVVHFAAESHVDRSIATPGRFVETNVLGTCVLLDAALRHRVRRFHHVSTDEVFGALPLHGEDKFTPETPYAPRSPYAASKAGSDHLVRAYQVTYGLPVTITNCSNNFGPYQYPEKLIALAITNLLEDRKIPIYGDGLYVRDWLYVEDHCRAIDLVLERGQIGATYLVGGMTELYSNLEVARKLLALLGKDERWIEHVTDRPGHDRRYDVDWTRIRQELGWQPLHPFDEWLARTVEWYRAHPHWWKPLKGR